jgi:predicted Na+-dependent transporter
MTIDLLCGGFFATIMLGHSAALVLSDLKADASYSRPIVWRSRGNFYPVIALLFLA